MSAHSDYLIIGGGVMGLMIARELAQAGADTLLIEQGQTGRQASWAGGGILSPLYPWKSSAAVTRLNQWSQTRYPALARELADTTGVDPEWTESGLLVLEAEEEESVSRWSNQTNCPVQRLNRTDLAKHTGSATGISTEALWLPRIAHIRNPRLLQALRHSLTGTSARVREAVRVTGIQMEGNRATGVLTTDGVVQSGAIIVATGAWTGKLLASCGNPIAIRPIRGQMLLFRAQPELLRCILLRRDRYLIPRRDGRILAGSTLEETGFDATTTSRARDELHHHALELLPALRHYPVEHHWAGLRPWADRDRPIIGSHPEIPGLFICAGHYRCGLALAPASARLLADLVLQRTPCLNSNPYGVFPAEPTSDSGATTAGRTPAPA